MNNCYVLFVKTGCEEKIVHKLKTRLDSSLFLPFIPTKEKLFKKHGKTIKIIELCFRGYLFIESGLSPDDFILKISPFLRMLDEVYRILNYGTKRDIAIHESERLMLKELFGNNYCIEASEGLIEGDKVRVIEGPLAGVEDVIRKINRHKKEALIEIDFMGDRRQITVSLEIVERI